MTECTHEGPCRGTCPKCEAELAYINRQLAARRKTGKAAIAAVMAAGMLFSAGCKAPDVPMGDVPNPDANYGEEELIEPLEGDVPYVPDDVLAGAPPAEAYEDYQNDE